MTYQPVYGIVSDEHCSRNTSSRWGKVHRIDFSGLTHFGAGIKVSLISEGKLPRKDIEEAKTKIVKWAEQGIIRADDQDTTFLPSIGFLACPWHSLPSWDMRAALCHSRSPRRMWGAIIPCRFRGRWARADHREQGF